MGLDTTHDCWHGAYSAFSRWRNELAKTAGYAIADINGHTTALIDWGHVTEAQLMGEWESTPSDPLIVLIAHSDCEGKINPAQAIPLAKRLEELVALLPDEDGGGHIGNWRGKTRLFIEGLREAAEADEPVEFH